MNRKGYTLFTLLSLFLLTACGVMEVGVEHAVTPTVEATTTPTPIILTRVVTRVGDAAAPALPAATPTATVPSPVKTPEPTASSTPPPEPTSPIPERSALQVAFVKEGNVWLWREDQGAGALTSAGGVSDVRMSDDGQIIAFLRGLELWAVNSDGTGERTLISTEDIAGMVEPSDHGLRLNRFEWQPGTHVVAFNTRADLELGLVLYDDLYLVDADTLEKVALLPRGKGGQFYYSPDGSQVTVVRSGTVDVVDADGGNRREAFTYTPPVTRSEYQYYARPVWATDGKSLRVAIPPADPHAQPPQLSSVWHLYTDGRPAHLIGTINARSLDEHAFSPDLGYVTYLQQSEGASPGASEGPLLITNLNDGETVTYHRKAGIVYGWAPDAQSFAFSIQAAHPQAQIGRLGSDPVPVHGELDAATVGVRWLDESRYLFTTITSQGRSLFMGEIGGSSTLVLTVGGRSLLYDYCLCGRPK